MPNLIGDTNNEKAARQLKASANLPSYLVDEIFNTPRYIVFSFELCSMAHVKAVIPLARELASRGHEIAFASPHDFRYDRWFQKASPSCPFSKFITLKTTHEYYGTTPDESMAQAFYKIHHNVEDGYNGWNFLSKQTLQRIKYLYEGAFLSLKDEFEARKPDLIVCDWLAMGSFDYCKTFNIPYVISISHSNTDFIPSNAAYIPTITSGHSTVSMSYFQRAFDLFAGSFIKNYYFLPVLRQLNKIRSKLGAPTSYDWSFSYRRKHIFVANYFGLEPVRYMSPFVHVVGPVILDETDSAKATIGGDLKEWLDDIANNRPGESVVLMAFGSLTSHKPAITKKLISGILFEQQGFVGKNGEFPTSREYLSPGIHLLWASAGANVNEILPPEVLANLSDYHLKIVDWVPQIAVLNHPAVKLFVTHGGAESQLEASRAAKPVLVYPGFYDQSYQATMAVELGYGEKLSPRDAVTSVEVCEKTKRLLRRFNEEPAFRRHLNNFAKIVFYNTYRPQQAADIVEMEADVGSDHLRPVEDAWPFYKRYNLDILFPPAILIALSIYLIPSNKPKW